MNPKLADALAYRLHVAWVAGSKPLYSRGDNTAGEMILEAFEPAREFFGLADLLVTSRSLDLAAVVYMLHLNKQAAPPIAWLGP
jgi:hypothetical protein